jgi:hypothetical protein
MPSASEVAAQLVEMGFDAAAAWWAADTTAAAHDTSVESALSRLLQQQTAAAAAVGGATAGAAGAGAAASTAAVPRPPPPAQPMAGLTAPPAPHSSPTVGGDGRSKKRQRVGGGAGAGGGAPLAASAALAAAGAAAPAPAAAAAGISAKASWECDLGDGDWTPYPPGVVPVIEQAYLRGLKAEFKLPFSCPRTGVLSHQSYEIDFTASLAHPQQRNVATKVCRNVRRRQCDRAAAGLRRLNSAELPCTWGPVPADKHCHMVSVEASSHEWQTVTDRMAKTMPSATILKIERIQNTYLHEYHLRNTSMAARV